MATPPSYGSFRLLSESLAVGFFFFPTWAEAEACGASLCPRQADDRHGLRSFFPLGLSSSCHHRSFSLLLRPRAPEPRWPPFSLFSLSRSMPVRRDAARDLSPLFALGEGALPRRRPFLSFLARSFFPRDSAPFFSFFPPDPQPTPPPPARGAGSLFFLSSSSSQAALSRRIVFICEPAPFFFLFSSAMAPSGSSDCCAGTPRRRVSLFWLFPWSGVVVGSLPGRRRQIVRRAFSPPDFGLCRWFTTTSCGAPGAVPLPSLLCDGRWPALFFFRSAGSRGATLLFFFFFLTTTT